MKWLHNSIQNKLQMIILNSFTIGSIYKLKKKQKKNQDSLSNLPTQQW